jgi:hypothetical protein
MPHKSWLKKSRGPSWISPIYGRYAIEVSPVLIEVERALNSSKLSRMMEIVNFQRPQLGISFIDTQLGLQKMIDHLRRFIFVRTESGVELTLRFADCVALSALAAVLNSDQWAALTSPFKSWKIHGRDGETLSLPIGCRRDATSLPLTLSASQIRALRGSTGTDQLLMDLRRQRPAPQFTYTTSLAFSYADHARRIWHAAGNTDDADLIVFAGKVFDTQGRLLKAPDLLRTLAQGDRGKVLADVQRLATGQLINVGRL